MVDSVAARWGSFRLAGAQVVWCDFGQPLRVPASDAWAWLRPVLSVSILSAPAAATPGQPLEAGPASHRGAPRPGVNAPIPAHLMTARLAPSGPGEDRRSPAADGLWRHQSAPYLAGHCGFEPSRDHPGLAGKTGAVNALGGLAVLMTDNVLADHGVPAQDVHYVPVPFPAMAAALAAHRVDAAFIAEPSLSAAEITNGGVPLFDVNQGAAQDFPISGYVVTRAWAARYPRTAAAFVRALERGQQVAATDRAAVEHALIPALHITGTTAAVMAFGTFLLSVSAVAVQRVADLMQKQRPAGQVREHGGTGQGADHPMSEQIRQAGPLAEQRVADGFAAAADGYDATGTEFFRQMGEHLVAQAGVAPGAVVLDLGCGKAAVTIPAARAAGPGGQVTGIDLALPMLDHARRAAQQAGLATVRFQPGDATAPPFPPGSFDVVLAGNLAQFLPHPMPQIAGCGSLLTRPGMLALPWNLAEDPYWVPVLAAFDTAMPPG